MAKTRASKKTTPGWSIVVLHFGYVESSRVAPMLMARAEPLPTKLDAVKDVAHWFFKKWREDHGCDEEMAPHACCKKSLVSNQAAQFCSTCGERLTAKEFDVERYINWLVDIQGRTADGFGWDDGMDEAVWTPWVKFECVMQAPQIVEIIEHAEEVLTYALNPEELPADADTAAAIAAYRDRMRAHHAANRLYKQNLDVDQLVDHEARAVVRA